jgi:hypothetical protein
MASDNRFYHTPSGSLPHNRAPLSQLSSFELLPPDFNAAICIARFWSSVETRVLSIFMWSL